VTDQVGSVLRRHAALLALVTGLLVGLPVALTLAREDSYESRIAIFLRGERAENEQTATRVQEYIEKLLPEDVVARGTALNVRFPLDKHTVLDNTRLQRRPDGGVDLVVKSGTPRRAAGVARLESSVIADRTAQRRARASRKRNLADTLQTVYGSASTAERSRARRRLRLLLAEIDREAPILVARGEATSESVTGSVDELVDRLPGEFAPDPGPIAAALAGLLLACGLFVAVALVGPLRPEK
jgi:hypothetical protein